VVFMGAGDIDSEFNFFYNKKWNYWKHLSYML
jgi:hypothetical protein